MLRNKIGPVFNARNVVFFWFLFLLFFEKSSSFCRENEIFKNKKTKQTKKLDQFLTLEKAKIGPVFNSTAYIYMYISINAKIWQRPRKTDPCCSKMFAKSQKFVRIKRGLQKFDPEIFTKRSSAKIDLIPVQILMSRFDCCCLMVWMRLFRRNVPFSRGRKSIVINRPYRLKAHNRCTVQNLKRARFSRAPAYIHVYVHRQ